jgi:ATP-dependent DNA helicase RecG
LSEGPLSSSDLRSKLNLKYHHTFRENYLHPALEQGFIEMTIPDVPTSRLQKYRLMEKGRRMIE